MWISDVLEKREYPPAGVQKASISYITFCQNYGYDRTKLSYKLSMCLAKEEYYYINNVNPIRFRDGLMGEECILLWGQEIIKTPSLPPHYDLTIDTLGIIMNVILTYLKTNVAGLKEYINTLISYRLLRDGDVIDNIIYLKPIHDLFYTQLEMNKNILEEILNSMIKTYTHNTSLEDLQIPSRLLYQTEEVKVKTVEDYKKHYIDWDMDNFEKEVTRVIKDYSKEEATNAILGLIYATKYEW